MADRMLKKWERDINRRGRKPAKKPDPAGGSLQQAMIKAGLVQPSKSDTSSAFGE